MNSKKKLLGVSSICAITAALAFAPGAGARATIADTCSETGDVCMEIAVNKREKIKFAIFTQSFTGAYELCVKGPSGKDCGEFELEQDSDGVYSDKVGWQKHFPSDAFGRYKVVWKYMG